MTLTTNGKNYIGEKFGSASKCYVLSGLNWTTLGTDNIVSNESGGTAQIVSRLVLQQVNQSVTISGITYTYADLKAANDDTDVFLTDAQWITQNDGSTATEPQYCTVPATKGRINCTSFPVGARIWVDNVDQLVNTPYLITEVEQGNHIVSFKMVGYNDCVLSNIAVVAGTISNADCTMTMTGTTMNEACKDWLANYVGIAGCYTTSGIVYTDHNGTEFTGGTGDVLNAFYQANIAGQPDAIIARSTSYNHLKTLNGYIDINQSDVNWVYTNDGHIDGVMEYCATQLPTYYKCTVVNGVGTCVEDPLGTFVDDPTCGGTCSTTPTKYNCVSGTCQGPFMTGTYNSIEECQAACTSVATKYNCVGGVCQGPFLTGTYNSIAECQAACTTPGTKYDCINGTCVGPYQIGDYNSLTECQNSCIPIPTKYRCTNGVCDGPYLTGEYNNLAACEAACHPPIPTKYNCVNGMCQGPFLTGTYSSLAACETACHPALKWKCTNAATNQCSQTIDGTYDTEALCKAASSCQPPLKWKCSDRENNTCVQASDGTFSTEADCKASANCQPSLKWKCVNSETNECAQTVDGTYNTEAECKAASSCQPPLKWKCSDRNTNTCIQAADGTYDTEALCKAANDCQIPPTGNNTILYLIGIGALAIHLSIKKVKAKKLDKDGKSKK